MLPRTVTEEIIDLLEVFPSITFLGPRQVGKTTLAKIILTHFQTQKNAQYFDLENENDRYILQTNTFSFLERLQDDLVVLDEVQVYPQIFSTLRSLIDALRTPGRFILLGSADPALVRGVSESLAGRTVYKEIFPINLNEAQQGSIDQNDHWLRGGLPEPLLMSKSNHRYKWTESFINTYVYRDINLLFGTNLNALTLQRIWNMLAHLHGQLENKEQIGRSLGVTGTTAKKYMDYLQGAYLLRRLAPWYVNNGKRLTKSPKIYIRGSGILHHLLGISDYDQLQINPIVGASWEGYVIEQIDSVLPDGSELFYYRTHHGAEVDLVLVKGGKPFATAEIKYSNAPKISRGVYECIKDLSTDKNYIITPGSRTFDLNESITVISLHEFLSTVKNF